MEGVSGEVRSDMYIVVSFLAKRKVKEVERRELCFISDLAQV